MKYSSIPKFHNNGNRDRFFNIGRLVPFLFTALAAATIFSFFILYSPYPFEFITKQGLDSVQNQQDHHVVQEQQHHHHDQNNVLSKPQDQQQQQHLDQNDIPPKPRIKESCDFFKGHWVPELRGSLLYTNSSCATIPNSKNCFRNGRIDNDFLNWRWKPDKCDLPTFDPKAFLEMVRGKKMAFVGDSVSRNHVESLLCLLSPVETPKDIYKDSEDRFRKWYFPGYDFTLMTLWTRFLIVGEERMVNGTGSGIFDLQLDKVDENWAGHIPEIDHAIISGGHWFFRVMYLHEGNNLTGCVYCSKPNVTDYNVAFIARMAFRAALNYINSCKNCNGLVTLLRTFAPAHFENGAWNTGGFCNRTSPTGEKEIDLSSFDLEMRTIQLEEIERVRKEEKQGKKFGVVDITRAMLMRPDGHPGANWGNKWMKGYNDCVHWCMPGPIDYWSDLLMAVLRKETGLDS